MLTIPNIQGGRLSTINGRASTINVQQAMPQYVYSDKMTLKQYLEAKNVQRKLQYRALNVQQGGSSPMKQQKQYQFQKQVHDLKGFIMHIIGEGSLFNKFTAMLDNLYVMFIKEITVYHKLKVDRDQRGDDLRIKQFRQANNKLAVYLKSCEDQSKQVQDRLEHIKKTKQFYKKQRQNQLALRMKKQQAQKKQAEKQRRRVQKQLRTSAKQVRDPQLAKTISKDDQLNISLKIPGSLNTTLKGQNENKNIIRDVNVDRNKLQLQPNFKNQKQQQQYMRRKQNIGKLSNVFASFIGS